MNSTSRATRPLAALTFSIALGASSATTASTLQFSSTNDVAAWTVAATTSRVDVNDIAAFPTDGFQAASLVTGRLSGTTQWIANNPTGSNGGVRAWTQFVFRQTFSLEGYKPTTADLTFRWAADDSGEGFADRGQWVPKFRLNGGPLIAWGTGPTYNLGDIVEITDGFVSGENTIEFFVQGNGQTDGFALEALSLTAMPMPLPAANVLFGGAMILLGSRAASRRVKAAA
ncbi:MAG: hypothetical protein AB7I01_21590 [Gammaproteobacteria bacterium]